MIAAEKQNRCCKACENLSKKIRFYGEGNPFYGKKHTDDLKVRFSKNRQGWYLGTKNKAKGNLGIKNPMYGRSVYNIWLEKYGEEVANEKLKIFKDKQSLLSIGTKNSMYGKTPGIGSGNGISGWYKEWYFRSLHELSYMIFVIERFNLKWSSAENKQYRIKYLDENNIIKNYYPDFIINDFYIIEIKPKALRNTKINKLKFEAARNYFKYLKFKVTSSPRIITKNELINMVYNNKVKLTRKWHNKIIPVSS